MQTRFYASIILGITLLAGLTGCPFQKKDPLVVLVGANLLPVVDSLADAFYKKTGKSVRFERAENGATLARFDQIHQADLCVEHDPFAQQFAGRGLVAESWVPAEMRPVIVVYNKNPRWIKGIKSLADSGLLLALPDFRKNTLGCLLTMSFAKSNLTDAITKNIEFTTRNDGEAANLVMRKKADAAVVWNITACQRMAQLDTVSVEPEYQVRAGMDVMTTATYGKTDMGAVKVTVSLLKSATKPSLAREFALFMVSDGSIAVWRHYGFVPILQ